MVVLSAALVLVLVPGSMSAANAVNASPLEVALAYLDKSAGTLGVGSADVEDMIVTSSYRSTHTGVTHVNLNQRLQELEVFGGHVTVNVTREGGVLFAGGSPVELGSASGTARLSATDAVRAAAAGLSLAQPSDLQVISQSGGPARETVVSGGGISDASIPLRLGWQPTEGGLRLAWRLVIDDSASDSLWEAAIDAENGQLLRTDDWTSKDTLDQLSATLSRSGSGSAARSSSTAAAAAAAQVADGSSYNVFAFPTESPNDASRQIVTNPADSIASPFGWHDTNGAAGAEFTTTQGNNAHAYLDQDDSESPDFGGSPNGGPSLTFDFPADLNQHAQNYREAVVTNLFYGNNRFHDVTHHYGFDEASGNFQANNYGRGGTGGDYVRAEAADGGGTNNANFSTPVSDGGTPRMQMFLWPGNQFGSQNQVVVDSLGSFNASWSRFGPAPTTAGLPGRTIVHAGTGCTAGLYPTPLPTGDWMVIVDGGTAACSYLTRVQLAQSLGADAVIVAHNTTAAAPVLTASMAGPPVGIPAVAITQADGNTIKAAVALGPTTGSVRKHPDHPGIRDGDFENGIIIHEYGHGVSNRLTGGEGINCLTGNEQAGEGWSDWLAITTLLDLALDNPEGPRGMGPYALFQPNRQGNGIRPRPYSRNMEIQPFTYDSIKTGGWLNGVSLAVPHGIGHGWASVLWDLTWELIDKHGFNPNLFAAWDSAGNTRALQYVMDGLKLQGCNPGFVVARAAIIAGADLSSNGEDTCTLWSSFARRGLGFSADQGTSASRDDNEEAFDTHPDCLEGFFGGIAAGPTLNVVNPGANRDMTFTLRGQPGARHPGEQLALLPPGRLQHAEDGRPGAVHHAAADPGPGRDAGQLGPLVRPGHGSLHVPVEDAEGVGRHLPRVRPHPSGRGAAPRLLPLLDRAVVPGLRARSQRGRRRSRGCHGQPRRREAGEPAHDHDRCERLLLVRERAQGDVSGNGVGDRLSCNGHAAGCRTGADDAELHAAAAHGQLRLLLHRRDGSVHRGGGERAHVPDLGRLVGDGRVAVPVPLLRAGVHDRLRVDERARELPRTQHVVEQRGASGDRYAERGDLRVLGRPAPRRVGQRPHRAARHGSEPEVRGRVAERPLLRRHDAEDRPQRRAP